MRKKENILNQQWVSALRSQAIETAVFHFDNFIEEIDVVWPVGDSPIERMLYAALVTYADFCHPEFKRLSLNSETPLHEMRGGYGGGLALAIKTQVKLQDWRVDFLCQVEDYRAAMGADGLYPIRSLIVECDGHDFHERTKKQAARDRMRDRWAQEKNYQIYRFTGSEIWNDPMTCAQQIFEWAARSL